MTITARTIERLKQAETWMFKKIRDERAWIISEGDKIKKVRHMTGFWDFRAAIPCGALEQVSIMTLEQLTNHTDSRAGKTKFNQPNPAHSECSDAEIAKLEFHDPTFMYEEAGVPANFDPLGDPLAIASMKREHQRLLDNDRKKEAAHLYEWMQEYFNPKTLRLNSFDRFVGGMNYSKPCAAARQRKRRALKRLEDAGFDRMAAHFKKFYLIHPFSFEYSPTTFIDWDIGSEKRRALLWGLGSTSVL